MRAKMAMTISSLSSLILLTVSFIIGANSKVLLSPPTSVELSSNTSVKPFYGCETAAYPPNKSTIMVQRFALDLALQPKMRWMSLIQQHKTEFLALVDYMKNLSITIIGEKAFEIIMDNIDDLTASLPTPYQEEMAGIAEASGLPSSQITFYNIFYEIFTFCTSIVIQDPQKNIYHGRNLDFGLLLGWNSTAHTWKVATLLKKIVVEVDWVKGNETLYSSVNFLGYVGIITAVKKGAFSLSVNERFALNGGYVGILEWILFKDYKQEWLPFLTRDVLEKAKTYTQARDMLTQPRLLAPVYFIVAGTQPGEGCIITRYRDGSRVLELGYSKYVAPWFLVQTNYDQWKEPPSYDDRRHPAINCLLSNNSSLVKGDNRNASLALLYNVLSTKPVLNKLTTYTSLIAPSDGFLASWIRDCPDPCWPW